MADDAHSTPSRAPHSPHDKSLPDPSAALVLWTETTKALCRTLGAKRGRRFVRAMAVGFADAEHIADLVPLRPSPAWVKLKAAREEAIELFRETLPALFASLPRETK